MYVSAPPTLAEDDGRLLSSAKKKFGFISIVLHLCNGSPVKNFVMQCILYTVSPPKHFVTCNLKSTAFLLNLKHKQHYVSLHTVSYQ